MSFFDRLPRRTPKAHPHRAPGRFTRVPLPPGLPGADTHLYVEMDEPGTSEPETDMTLVAAPPDGPDATMHFPAVEADESPAARPGSVPPFGMSARAFGSTANATPAPLPVPHFDVPAGFPPASAWSAGPEVLRRAAESLRALPVRPGAHLRNITPGDDPNPYDQLAGFPVFAGTTLAVDGHPAAGLYLGNEDAAGRIVLDVFDPAWLDELIDAAVRARRALDAMTQTPADEDDAAEGGAAA